MLPDGLDASITGGADHALAVDVVADDAVAGARRLVIPCAPSLGSPGRQEVGSAGPERFTEWKAALINEAAGKAPHLFRMLEEDVRKGKFQPLPAQPHFLRNVGREMELFK
jgi:hypothetical protein